LMNTWSKNGKVLLCPLYVLDAPNSFHPHQCVHPTRLAVVYERTARLHPNAQRAEVHLSVPVRIIPF
jgi:hypothetical protein